MNRKGWHSDHRRCQSPGAEGASLPAESCPTLGKTRANCSCAGVRRRRTAWPPGPASPIWGKVSHRFPWLPSGPAWKKPRTASVHLPQGSRFYSAGKRCGRNTPARPLENRVPPGSWAARRKAGTARHRIWANSDTPHRCCAGRRNPPPVYRPIGPHP